MKARVFTSNINGVPWTFRFTHLHANRGYCDFHKKEIAVKNNLPLAEKVEVIIHEMLHAGDFDKDEQWVERLAVCITNVLIEEHALREECTKLKDPYSG